MGDVPFPVPVPSSDTLRADILRGLARRPKRIPCKHLYDAAGSALFDRICALPEYYLTRAELSIMRHHAGEMAAALGPDCLLIEYGSGSSIKTCYLLDRLASPAGYVPVDISGEHLGRSAAALARRYPGLAVRPLHADFTRLAPSILGADRPGRRVVYFPGSTIGNFTPRQSVALLRRTARLCGPGGGLLLGADLKKAPHLLHAAYNDAQGVTAAFNLNLLTRINRELGGDFPVREFWHHAFYRPDAGRVEMHLVSRRPQEVHVAGQVFPFAEGESIRTEYSYKYGAEQLRRLAAAGGFEVRQTWHDLGRAFCVLYLTVAPVRHRGSAARPGSPPETPFSG